MFCQSFPIVANVYELVCTLKQDSSNNKEPIACLANEHIENLIDVGHFMLALNSSINFIFYMIYMKKFKEQFLKVSMFALYEVETY